MPSARTLLNQLKRHQASRSASRSPIEAWYGSFEAYAEGVEAQIGPDGLDRTDMPIVLNCLRKWHTDGVWDKWHRTGHRVQEQGA